MTVPAVTLRVLFYIARSKNFDLRKELYGEPALGDANLQVGAAEHGNVEVSRTFISSK